MKTKIISNAVKVLFACALIMGNIGDKKLAPSHKGLLAQAKSFYKIISHGHVWNDAHALTVLGQADVVRFMYWLINGPPAGGYPAPYDGPSGGFLGMIRNINGPTALGGGLSSCGYSTCSAIPSTGSCSMTDSDGTFTMTFAAPSVSVPAGYTSGASAGFYDKRIAVNYSDGTNNVDFMLAEINCDSSSGWMRFHEPNNQGVSYTAANRNTARNIEVFYDTVSASATKMELVMYRIPTAPSGVGDNEDEKFVVKFATEADSKFKIWLTRYSYDGTNQKGFRIAVYGDFVNDLANVFMEQDSTPDANTTTTVNTDSGDTATQDIDCIDFNAGGSALDAAGSCGALTLTTAGAPLKDATGDFSMEWARDTLATKLTTY